LRRVSFESVEQITSNLESTRFNELEITYGVNQVKIAGIGVAVSVVGVLTVSPSCNLWFKSAEWPTGGDRAARNRRMNAKAAEVALSHYKITHEPSIFEIAISIDSRHAADVVLDAFAEWLAGCIPNALEPLRIFGCVDAGGPEFFVKLESNVTMTADIRVFAKLFPPTYPELGRRFDALHPILFGDEHVCASVGRRLGQDSRIIESRSLADFAVLRLASGCDIGDASRRVSEWLLLPPG
jgi:hypothetical protein